MADLKEIGKQAKAARYILAGLDTNTRISAFTRQNVWKRTQQTFPAENAKDLEARTQPQHAERACLTGSP